MLYKNNERYTRTAEDDKRIKKFVGDRWPVVVRFTKDMYTPNPNSQDRNRVDRPPMALIPMMELVTNESGSQDQWVFTNYAPTKDKAGDLVFHTQGDAYLHFSGSLSLTKERDMDLIFFLCEISRSSSHSTEKNRATFEIQNNSKAADMEMEKEERETLVRSAISGPTRMPHQQILEVGKVFSLIFTQDMSENECRKMLKDAVFNRENSMKDGFKLLLDAVDNDARTKAIGVIGKAKNLGVVAFHLVSKKWILMGEDGKKAKDLCGMVKNKNEDESLLHHAFLTPAIVTDITEAVAKFEDAANKEAA